MDAKEAIVELTKMLEYENYVFNCIADDNEPETVEVQRNIKSLQLAISALEKVPVLEAENARLKINAEKWADLLKRAGAVGLNETDFFKMVETDKE